MLFHGRGGIVIFVRELFKVVCHELSIIRFCFVTLSQFFVLQGKREVRFYAAC